MSLALYTSNEMFLQNNALRRKILAMWYLTSPNTVLSNLKKRDSRTGVFL